MPRISIFIDDDEKKILSKRAKKNLMTLTEQIEDIVRRSALSTKNRKNISGKSDDALVAVFSREKRGNYRRKKRKS